MQHAVCCPCAALEPYYKTFRRCLYEFNAALDDVCGRCKKESEAWNLEPRAPSLEVGNLSEEPAMIEPLSTQPFG